MMIDQARQIVDKIFGHPTSRGYNKIRVVFNANERRCNFANAVRDEFITGINDWSKMLDKQYRIDRWAFYKYAYFLWDVAYYSFKRLAKKIKGKP